MILYHGSNTEVNKINLSICKPFRDFGKGFYLTSIRSQAENMAKRTARIKGGTPVLNAYEIDDLEMLKKRMAYKELSMQYSFHTEKAIALLKKQGTIYG